MRWIDPDIYNPTPDSPETRLSAAIIYQALEDLLFPRNNEPSATDKDRGDALSFFTATTGPWAQSRRDFCDAAGFDAEVIREKIVAILEGADFQVPNWMPGQGRRSETLSAKNLELARDLWRQAKTPPVRCQKTPPAVLTAPPARLVGRPTSIPPLPEIDQEAAAAYEPEPIEVVRARSEQIMAELDAMRAA